MRELIKDSYRIKLFEHYNEFDNPFLYVTTKIDITNIYNKCRTYYGSIGYFIALAVNQIDNFRYRYEDGNFYKYDIVNPNFTDMFSDNNIGYFTCEYKNKYKDFLEEYNSVRDKFIKNNKSYATSKQNEIWLSCAPWYNTSSIVTPFNKNITIPQFLWDKFSLENDRCYINLTIMVHHGFVDGYHIGLFLEKLNNIIENIDDYI